MYHNLRLDVKCKLKSRIGRRSARHHRRVNLLRQSPNQIEIGMSVITVAASMITESIQPGGG